MVDSSPEEAVVDASPEAVVSSTDGSVELASYFLIQNTLKRGIFHKTKIMIINIDLCNNNASD